MNVMAIVPTVSVGKTVRKMMTISGGDEDEDDGGEADNGGEADDFLSFLKNAINAYENRHNNN